MAPVDSPRRPNATDVARLGGRLPAWLAGLTILLAPPAWAEWRSLPEESRLFFTPSFQGVELPGRFERFKVTLAVEPGTAGDNVLRVTVQVDSADLDDPDLNEGVRDADWFDIAGYPQATFTSDHIGPAGDGFAADGILTLKGHALRVRVPFHWRAESDRAVMTGELGLSRRAFGIGEGEWAEDDTIGDLVDVRFSVTLARAE
jgi:polyisoprenoid-binding protein YceI